MLKMSEMRARVRADVKRHREEAMRCPKIARDGLRVLSKLAPALKRAKLEPSVYAGVSGKIYVSVSLEVKSFKEARLVNMLEAAMEKIGDKDVGSQDFAEMRLREYRIRCESLLFEVNARLEGEGNPLCRRVKVDESVQVVEKYEFRCD